MERGRNQSVSMRPPGDHRVPVTALGALVVALSTMLVGGAVYLVLPAHEEPADDPRPPAENIDAASDSVSSAKMMFQLMSAGLNSASGGITTATGSVRDLFGAVDKAAAASDQLVTGLKSAPQLSAAAGEANRAITAVGAAVEQATSVADSVEQVDSMVTPVIEYLDKSPTPGSAAALERLRALQKSSREIAGQLGSLDNLRSELTTMRGALSSSAAGIDNAIGQARAAAGQLSTGFRTLASARADTVSAADKVTAGLGQLQSVLGSINEDLDNASTNLTPVEHDAPGQNAATAGSVDDVAQRVSWALVAGASVGVVLLGVLLLRARRHRGQDGPLDKDSADNGVDGSDDSDELVGAGDMPQR